MLIFKFYTSYNLSFYFLCQLISQLFKYCGNKFFNIIKLYSQLIKEKAQNVTIFVLLF